jgi:hypothetical protein
MVIDQSPYSICVAPLHSLLTVGKAKLQLTVKVDLGGDRKTKATGMIFAYFISTEMIS